MKDLIYRQDAIDALEEVDWYHQNKDKDMVLGANPPEHQAWYKEDDIFKTLEALPSAQPEKMQLSREDATFDCISRQAAIDLIKNDAFWVQYAWGGRGHKPEMEMVDDLVESIIKQMKESVVSRLEQMPSAQPERKRGEWEEIEVIADAYDISGVKTWASKMKCDQCGFTTIAIEGRFSQYNFCPNCGADMRGEDHEFD